MQPALRAPANRRTHPQRSVGVDLPTRWTRGLGLCHAARNLLRHRCAVSAPLWARSVAAGPLLARRAIGHFKSAGVFETRVPALQNLLSRRRVSPEVLAHSPQLFVANVSDTAQKSKSISPGSCRSFFPPISCGDRSRLLNRNSVRIKIGSMGWRIQI